MSAAEVSDSFDCFGSSCGVLVTGDGAERSAPAALGHARSSCSVGIAASRASCPTASCRG